MTDLFLEPNVMNYTGDKYQLIHLSLRWGRALKAKGTPTPLAMLVEQALRDIVEGRVTAEEIMAAHAPVEVPSTEALPAVVSVADDGASEAKAALLAADGEGEGKKKLKKKKKDDA
jgi:hypothetical protein